MKEAEVFIGKMRTSWAQIDEKTKDTALCVLVGGVAFGSTLALSTFTQWRVLGITTGTPMPTPTLVGMASVCAASWVSHQAALFSHHCIAYNRLDPSQRQKSSLWHSWKEKEERALLEYQWINRNDFLDVSYFKVPWHTIRM